MRVPFTLRTLGIFSFFFLFLSFSVFSRQLVWRGTLDNNGSRLANYVELPGNTVPTGSVNIQATDTLFFIEGNITATIPAGPTGIVFQTGTPCARFIVTDNVTSTPYIFTFNSTGGTTIYGNIEISGTLAHQLKGQVNVNNTTDHSNFSLIVNGDILISDPNTTLNSLNLQCAGRSGSTNVLDLPNLAFVSGFLKINVSETLTNSGTSYEIINDLILENVKVEFKNGSFASNGHTISSNYSDATWYSENFNRSTFWFNVGGGTGKKGVINLSNSKIISKGNITVFAYNPSKVSYNVSGVEFELHSADFLISQLPAGEYPYASQRLLWNNIDKISFLSDGTGGNQSHYLWEGILRQSYFNTKKWFIDRQDFEFRGGGADLPASTVYFTNADTLELTSMVKRVGYSQIAQPWRFGRIIAPNGGSCRSNLLFENLPDINTSTVRGKISLSNPVVIPYLAVRSIQVTGPSLNAGYNLGNNVVDANLSFSPPPSQIFYWVGGAGDWHNADHWSIGNSPLGTYPTSGNTNPLGCLPTIVDSVVFDANSGLAGATVQILPDSIAYCRGMLWDNAGATAFNGSSKLFISGNFKNNGGVSTVGTPFYFVLGGSRTIESGGAIFNGLWEFGHTGQYMLLDNLTGNIWKHYMGTVHTNAQTVNISRYYHPYDGYWSLYPTNSFQSRTLNITNSTINITSLTPWSVWANSFTLQANGSTINLLASTGNIAFEILGSGAQENYWDINVVNNPDYLTTFTSPINVSFNDMTFTGNTDFTDGATSTTWTAHDMQFAKNFTYDFNQINMFNLTGYWSIVPPTCGGMTFFTSHIDSTFRINATNPQNISESMLTRINATPGQSFTVTNGVDAGGNFNVNFLLGASNTFYWRGGNASNTSTTSRIDWDNGENWAINNPTDLNPLVLSNTGRCIPGPGDSVVFDNESFASSGGSNQVMINSTAYCRDIVWTPGSVSLTTPVFNFNTNKQLHVYRSLAFTSGMTFSGTNAPIYFLAPSGVNATIDFGGIPLTTGAGTFISNNGDLYLNGAGTFNILSDIPSRYFMHQNGNLSTNGYTLYGYGWGSYSSINSGIAGSVRTIDFSTSKIELAGGGRVFQMDYQDLTSLQASNVTVESNSTTGAGEFRHIRVENATVTPLYGQVKNVTSTISYRGVGAINYLPSGGSTGDLRWIANGSRPSVFIKKLEYAPNSVTSTFGNFEIDTLVLGRSNDFYINAIYTINDTVITNGVVCRTTVIRGGIEYTHHTTPSISQNGISTFLSPTCDLQLQSVNMSNVTADISSCGSSSYFYSGIDGGMNTNWTFDPVSSFPQNTDTTTVACTDFPYQLSLPYYFGASGVSILWNTGSTTDTTYINMPGTYNVTVNYGSGCVLSDTFNIVVDDTISPIINCPSDTTIQSDANCQLTIPDFTSSITATDNCSVQGVDLILTQNPTSGTIVSSGDTTVWIYAVDAYGNEDSCSFLVTAQDLTPPTILSCVNDTNLYTEITSCNAIVPDFTSNTSINVTDNCSSMTNGTITITQNPTAGSTITGTSTIWIYATDANNNTDSCSFVVTVNDTINPVITCISDTIVASDANCNLVIPDFTNALTITDNCSTVGVDLVVTQNPLPGILVTSGDTTVWIYATDASGNKDSCSFIVTATDLTPPTIITCVTDTTLSAGAGSCSTTLPDFTGNGTIDVTDNCSSMANGTITITQNPASGTIISGTSTVWIYATDANNNTDSCSFQVTVISMLDSIVLATTSDSACAGSSVTLSVVNSNPNYMYNWSFNGTVVASGDSYTINPQMNQSGIYTVTAINNSGCPPQTSEISLTVLPCGIVIPESFSPNNNGVNEYFYIENLELFPNSLIWIYNRWGTEVYQSDNYQNDWDGRSQSKYNVAGDELPEGTYYYIFQLGGTEGQEGFGEIYKGFVYLKR